MILINKLDNQRHSSRQMPKPWGPWSWQTKKKIESTFRLKSPFVTLFSILFKPSMDCMMPTTLQKAALIRSASTLSCWSLLETLPQTQSGGNISSAKHYMSRLSWQTLSLDIRSTLRTMWMRKLQFRICQILGISLWYYMNIYFVALCSLPFCPQTWFYSRLISTQLLRTLIHV